MPSACAATLGRDLLSEASSSGRPWPGSPSRLARGTRQSSKASAAVDEARCPILSSLRSTERPGVPFSRYERRDRLTAVGDLGPFAEHEDQVGDIAVGDEDLAAVDDDVVAVGREARLHAGRVRAGLGLGDRQRARARPSATRGRRRRFCSSLPKSISGFIAWKFVAQMMPVEAQARLISRTQAR